MPPPNVRVGEVKSRSIELLFDNIADPFLIYGHAIASKVNLTSVSDIFDHKEIQYGDVNSVVLTNLHSYTNYTLSVAIGTRRGFEVFSTPILVRTDFGRKFQCFNSTFCIVL